MKLLAPTTNTAGTCPLPLIAEYSLATGEATTHGFVGTREAMQAAYETLIDAGYRNVRFEEQESGIVRVTGTFGAVNKDDPNDPTANETPEITWEMIGNDETADLDRTEKGKYIDNQANGILKAIEACVDKYRSFISSKELWEQQTGSEQYTQDPTTGALTNVAVTDTTKIASDIKDAYANCINVIKALGKAGTTDVSELAVKLFEWKVQNVTQFLFTRWALRKSVAFSSLKSVVARDLIEGIFQNTDKYFTSDLVLSRETTLPAALSYSIPKTYTDPLTNKIQGYYLKHMPHVQTSSTGRVTATVEYAYTLDLCDFAYEAAT